MSLPEPRRTLQTIRASFGQSPIETNTSRRSHPTSSAPYSRPCVGSQDDCELDRPTVGETYRFLSGSIVKITLCCNLLKLEVILRGWVSGTISATGSSGRRRRLTCLAGRLIDHQQPHHRAGTAGSLAVKLLQQGLQLALTCQIARPRAGHPPEQYQVRAQENQDTRQGRPVEFPPRHVIDPMASDGDG
jgi:hypothetical protein